MARTGNARRYCSQIRTPLLCDYAFAYLDYWANGGRFPSMEGLNAADVHRITSTIRALVICQESDFSEAAPDFDNNCQ